MTQPLDEQAVRELIARSRSFAERKALDGQGYDARTVHDILDTLETLLTATRADGIREALEAMVEEKCDYMRINNLGDPETQHTVKAARAALSSQPAKPVADDRLNMCVHGADKGSYCGYCGGYSQGSVG
jgi:hypothetical protein